MNKSDRLAMIRNRWKNRSKLAFVLSTGLLPVSPEEIAETVKLDIEADRDKAETYRQDTDLLDESIAGIESQLDAEPVHETETDGETYLSRNEKNRLKREVNQARFRTLALGFSKPLLLAY